MNNLTLLLLLSVVCAGCATAPRLSPPAPVAIKTPAPKLPSVHTICHETPDALLVSNSAMSALPSELQNISDKLDDSGKEPFVVVHYGDSHTRAASLPRALRDLFGSGGPASPGFIAPGHPVAWDASVSHHGSWTRHNWLYGKDKPSFGPMGLAYSTRAPGSRLTLKLKQNTHGANVTLFYAKRAGHLPFRVEADGFPLQHVPSATLPIDGFDLGHAEAHLLPGQRKLDLVVEGKRGSGSEFRFYGALVRYPNAVIEWDAMGIGGTTIRGPVRRSDHTFNQYLDYRDPDLLVVWYGSNSAAEKNLNTDRYGDEFDTLIDRLRDNAPNAACLIIGPPDLNRPTGTCSRDDGARPKARRSPRRSASRNRTVRRTPRRRAKRSKRTVHTAQRRQGRIDLLTPAPRAQKSQRRRASPPSSGPGCQYKTVRPLPDIVQAQREAAERHGCIYFNTFDFMGGSESIKRWAQQKPALASGDMVHLTSTGYQTVAKAIFSALQVLLEDLRAQRTAHQCPALAETSKTHMTKR